MSFLDTFGDDWTETAAVESDDDAPEVEAKEPDETPEPEAEAEEPEVEKTDAETESKPTHTVPYAEMKREREKRQDAERRLAEMQQPRPQVHAPKLDAYEQPEAFNQHFESQFAQQQWALRAEFDGFRAEQTYGKETVEAAIAWGQEQGARDPSLGLKVQNSSTPVETLVKEYQQNRTLETLGGKSFEDAAKEYAVKQGWAVSQGETLQPKLSPKAPSPSLTRRPGQGGSNQNATDAFEGIFSSDKMGLR